MIIDRENKLQSVYLYDKLYKLQILWNKYLEVGELNYISAQLDSQCVSKYRTANIL